MGRAALELAHELEAPFYSLHAGFAAKLKPELLGKPESQANALTAADINRGRAYEIMVQTVRELADFADSMGLELLIENNVISPLYLEKMPINPLLLTEGGEIVRFFEDVQRPNVGLLLDVAHAKVSATALGFSPEAFVDQVADHVRCLHLSDNDGREDSNQPFAASAWFMSRLRDFAHCEIVVEAYRLPPQTMLSQRELLERILS
jgi:sugar phosphate isomerase/epimerase